MTKINNRRIRKPFMIERNGKDFGAIGDDFAKVKYLTPEIMRVSWVDWEGSRYEEKRDAQEIIDANPSLFPGAKVIEIIEEIRVRS